MKAVAAELADADLASLTRAVADDQRHWDAEFGVAKDVSGLGVERNVFRYLPVPVEVRFDGDRSSDLIRVASAGNRAGAPVTVSLGEAPTPGVRNALIQLGSTVTIETESDWAARLHSAGALRVRLVGDRTRSAEAALLEATGGSPDVAVYAGPVTEAGRIEMLPFLHEQAVAITAHRFGNPDNISHTVF